MADHADVMDLLEDIARNAVYVDGTSVTGRHVTVGQGWPQAADVDKAMQAKQSIVSIYSEPSSTSATVTPVNSSYVSKPAVAGTVVAYDDELGTITISGTPSVGDNIFISLGQDTYQYAPQAGDTSDAVAAALLAQVLPARPDATLDNGVLSAPSAQKVYAAVSGTGEVATKIHSARTQYEIVVWAPSPSDRTVLARAVELAVKDQVRWPLADTTSVIVTWQGTNLRDKEEKVGVFRRDIIVNAIYETIKTAPAQQIVGALLQSSS